MVAPIVTGGNYLLRGLALLVQPGIRRYVIIPLVINTLLFGLVIGYMVNWFHGIFGWIDNLLPSWLSWIEWLVIPILLTTFAATIFSTLSMLINLLAAPFNTLLAERVEYHLTSQLPKGTPITPAFLLTKTVPLLWNEIYKILYALFWMIPFLLLFIVPVANVAAPFLWLLYSAWMLAIQYVDLPMGNHELTGKQVRQSLRRHRLLSMGFGGMTLLINTLPLINFVAMPAAVAGATLLWVEQLSKDQTAL
ncbi:MAG: sulfate transporter CysZ [Magnetococcales bacterium]|nr:sulfate transporter CysZ [Magnetococcales bacterium]